MTITISTFIVSAFVIFVKTTWDVSLSEAKLETVSNNNLIKVFDSEGQELDLEYTFTGKTFVKIEELPSFVKNAFIAMEDKRFYKHNGVDYKRIIGAMVNNIKKQGFSQGGSTISQQLIKNTHLSREKTIERKFKEIKLAYSLEKKYSKDEILEMYLNNIYFGNGCYGLEKASNYYFSKKAKELSVGEAAMLVGVVNAPSIYDPINNNVGAEKRKKLVLKLMNNQGYISDAIYEKSANNKEIIKKTTKKHQNSYLKNILSESCKVLKISENQLKNMNLKIETNLNSDVQNVVSNVLEDVVNSDSYLNKHQYGVVVIDNKNKGVVASCSSRNVDVYKTKRQPGSAIKPILVYAPALENGLIHVDDVIVDEKININGYSPFNANKKFSGEVTIRESVEKSLNVPAVKVLSKVGVKRAKAFASNLGIKFSSEDNNLALALGGMTEGVTLKELADAYSAFATKGEFKESKIIKRILDENNNVLYENKIPNKKVMSEETAYLMSDLLKGVVLNGTARRLNVFKFDLASKTGTVGLQSSSKNTDAFNIAYTVDYTIVSWMGSLDNEDCMNSNVNGSTYPTIINKKILSSIYKNVNVDKFEKPEGVVFKNIDKKSLKEGFIGLAKEEVVNNEKKLSIFNEKFLPNIYERKVLEKPVLKVKMEEGEKPTLLFDVKKDYTYQLCRVDCDGNEKILLNITNQEKTQKYTDECAKSGEIYDYFVKIIDKNQNVLYESNIIKLMSF